MKHLQALLQGKCTSHILPFLWMKGEDNETIGKELDKIEKCGIREVCLESRPHPDFCGPKWWENLDFICAEAEKRGLRLWILDDKKFPTGYANGGFEKHPDIWTLWVPAAAVQSWWKILFLQMEDYWEFWQYQSQMDRPWQ